MTAIRDTKEGQRSMTENLKAMMDAMTVRVDVFEKEHDVLLILEKSQHRSIFEVTVKPKSI